MSPKTDQGRRGGASAVGDPDLFARQTRRMDLGPDDSHPDVDGEALRLLLRSIFGAAGGMHDDWDTYDRVMEEERRAAVLITPRRTYTNPTS